AEKEFGKNSAEASKAQNAYNRQVKTVKELERQLNEAKTAMTKTQREMSDLSKEAEDLTDSLDKAGGGVSALGDKLKGAFVGGAVVGAVTGLAGSIADLSEKSLEYNKIMGTLSVSGQHAGYTAEQTKESYLQLYGVIGDQQQTATALANLQAIGLNQEQLRQMTDLATGAWMKYGDSIPIDGLAEAINETIQVGVVTGNFADALNWASISEDEFNEKLAAAGSEAERVNLVMEALASQGLAETTAAWREENAAIVEANLATERLTGATAEFGAFFTPVVTAAKNLAADFLLGVVDIGTEFLKLPGYAKESLGNIGKAITTGINELTALPGKMLQVGVDSLAMVAAGNQQQLPVLLEQDEAIMGEMVDTMQGFQPDFQDTGYDLMRGVKVGIDQGRSGVINSIKAALRAAVAEANEEMDIHSPSGVTEDTGDFLAQGIGVGFVKRMKTVTKDIVDALPFSSGNQKLAFAGTGSQTYSYGDINLFIDRVDNGNGRSVETLARELEFYRRQQTGGRGGKL
ncbi:MAG: hypothetical protein IIV02_06160, partial [Peptococcaceae bacterium]|nr:hypothetical protein [Peptococcaceae bacterium]